MSSDSSYDISSSSSYGETSSSFLNSSFSRSLSSSLSSSSSTSSLLHSSSSSSYILPFINRVVNISIGYLGIKGNITNTVAFERPLYREGSTELHSVCVDNSGIIYATDPVQNIIIKLTPNGDVSLFAGQPGISGNNGNNIVPPNEALFNSPKGIAVDASGRIYVADSGNNQIRRIDKDYGVSLVAGSPDGEAGNKSDIGHLARFNNPLSIAVDASGNLYVADTGNNIIRKIQGGTSKVSIIAGDSTRGDYISPDHIGTNCKLNLPTAVTVDNSGRVFIGDSGNHKIKILDTNLRLWHLSGSGVAGYSIGNTLTSTYGYFRSFDTARSNSIYIVDSYFDRSVRLLRVDDNGNSFEIAYEAEFGNILAATINNSELLYMVETDFDNFSSSSSLGFSSSSSSSLSSSLMHSSSSTSSSSSSSSLVYSSSSMSSSSSLIYSSSSHSSSSSLGDCEKVNVKLIGADRFNFITPLYEDWGIGEEVCLNSYSGGKRDGIVYLIAAPTVYVQANQSLVGFINDNDSALLCHGTCSSQTSEGFSSSKSSMGISSASSRSSTSQSSILYSSSESTPSSMSSSVGNCENTIVQIVSGINLVFVTKYSGDWVEGEEVCVTNSMGQEVNGYINDIVTDNIFLQMEVDMSGLLSNGDFMNICKGSCVSSKSSRSSSIFISSISSSSSSISSSFYNSTSSSSSKSSNSS